MNTRNTGCAEYLVKSQTWKGLLKAVVCGCLKFAAMQKRKKKLKARYKRKLLRLYCEFICRKETEFISKKIMTAHGFRCVVWIIFLPHSL